MCRTVGMFVFVCVAFPRHLAGTCLTVFCFSTLGSALKIIECVFAKQLMETMLPPCCYSQSVLVLPKSLQRHQLTAETGMIGPQRFISPLSDI